MNVSTHQTDTFNDSDNDLLLNINPLPVPMLSYCQLDLCEQISVKLQSQYHNFTYMKMILKLSSAKWQPFCYASNVLITFWEYTICDQLVPIVSVEYLDCAYWAGAGETVRVGSLAKGYHQRANQRHCHRAGHWSGGGANTEVIDPGCKTMCSMPGYVKVKPSAQGQAG